MIAEGLMQRYSYVSPAPRKIIGGPGALDELSRVTEELAVYRAVIITSPSLVQEARVLERVRSCLGDRYVGTFADVKPHTPISVVEQALDAVRALGADGVVSLGGGSSVDTAKGVAWYRDEGSSESSMTHVAIPSTFSGAELTTDAGITLPDGKRVHRHRKIVPAAVILDPDVPATAPITLLQTSLLNALAHCLEGLVSVAASPMSDAALVHAVRLLNAAHMQLDTTEGRYLAQAGAALSVADQMEMGLAHALVHVVGGRFKTPHGATHAIVGPAVMRFNLPHVARQQCLIAEAFGVDTSELSPVEAAWEAVEAARGIATRLGVPAGLRDLGVPKEALRAVAEEVPSDPCFATNPRPIESPDETLVALEWAWSGEIPPP